MSKNMEPSPGADPGLTVGGCLGYQDDTARVSAREILCATPTFGVISERVRMHDDVVPLNFELFYCS